MKLPLALIVFALTEYGCKAKELNESNIEIFQNADSVSETIYKYFNISSDTSSIYIYTNDSTHFAEWFTFDSYAVFKSYAIIAKNDTILCLYNPGSSCFSLFSPKLPICQYCSIFGKVTDIVCYNMNDSVSIYEIQIDDEISGHLFNYVIHNKNEGLKAYGFLSPQSSHTDDFKLKTLFLEYVVQAIYNSSDEDNA